MIAALWYAGHGWKVFPLKPRSKAPATAHGYQDAITDADQVAAWWQQAPDANVGIAAAPSGLIVLDFDAAKPEYAGDVLLAELVSRHPTVMSATPSGGWHLVYAQPADWQPSNATGKLPTAVDVRSAGYIAAPPSIHPNGKPYRWVQGHAPHELTPSTLPAFVVELITPTAKPTPVRELPTPSQPDTVTSIVERISRSRQGDEFRRLYAGQHNYPNHSEADAALVRLVSWWCDGDVSKMLAIWQSSGLWRGAPRCTDNYVKHTLAHGVTGNRSQRRVTA